MYPLTYGKSATFDPDIPWPEARQLEEVLNTLYRRDPVPLWFDADYGSFRDVRGAPYARVRLLIKRGTSMHLYLKEESKLLTLETPVYFCPPNGTCDFLLKEMPELPAPFWLRMDTVGMRRLEVLVLWAQYRFERFAEHGVELLGDFITKTEQVKAELKVHFVRGYPTLVPSDGDDLPF